MSSGRAAVWAYTLAAAMTAACSGGGDAHGSANSPAPGVDGGSPGDDSAGPIGLEDAKIIVTDGAPDAPSPDATSQGGPAGDGAGPDAGPASTDGALSADGGAEGGTRDIGSCCSAQTTPGCDDPNLEVCVCQKIASCCTTAWTLACALIVQQKYCQPNVRDCVCGTDAGQWGQTQCCMNDWTSTCDSVATLKCNAAQGCF